MAAKLKVGIIGSGMISGSHLEAYKKDPRVEVAWVADVLADRAAARAKEFGVKKAITDYRKGLGEVDAVSVCTPPFAHKAPVLDAAKAGVHVLCEKPMALSTADARAMQTACAKARVTLGICSARAVGAGHLAARDAVARGKLGKVYYSRLTSLRRRGRPGLDFWPNVTWFLNKKKAGGGAVMDIGCYDIDMLLFVLGAPQPVSVSASSETHIGSQRVPKGVVHDTEEHLSAFVRFANGSTAQFETAWAANMVAWDFALFGTKGGIRLGDKPKFYGENGKGKTVDLPLKTNGFKSAGLQGDFVNAVLGRKAPYTPGTTGVKIMQIIEGALKSAKLGREVRVAEL